MSEDPLREYLAFSLDEFIKPRDLIHAVAELLTEKYGPPLLARLPEGLRLEMHPSVLRLFHMDSSLFPMWNGNPDELFRVPVRVTIHIPKDTWRLVIVTEEVLVGGSMKLAPPGDKGTGGA